MVQYIEAPPFSLTIMAGGESGERFVFEQPEVTLGRSTDNDLVLYDASVSRRHSVLYYRNEQFILEDLGSINGTILNGYRITQPSVLCEGDLIDISAVRFQFSNNVFHDNDEPTEIEGWSHSYDALPIAAKEPIAIPKQAMISGMPLPSEGSTQTFSTHKLQELREQYPATPSIQNAQGSYRADIIPPRERADIIPPREQQAHTDYAKPYEQPIQRPDWVNDSHGRSPISTEIPPSTNNAPTPLGVNPSSNRAISKAGIKPPAHPPPSGNISPSTTNHAADTSKRAFPGHAISQPQKSQRKRSHIQRAQRQRIAHITLWSCVLILLATAFLLMPNQQPTRKLHKITPILLQTNNVDDKQYKKIYGYNKDDRSHPHQILFQFPYNNGNITISYRLLSHTPVDVLLNNQALAHIQPSPTVWFYNRHQLPLHRLQAGQINTIAFRRIEADNRNPLWGLTHIRLQEQALPSPDKEKANQACQKGYQIYEQRDKQPVLRYQAINYFWQCMGYVALMKELPPLYNEAESMINRINNELDVIYDQHIKKASQTQPPHQSKAIYQFLLKYFQLDTDDPRYQRIWETLQKL